MPDTTKATETEFVETLKKGVDEVVDRETITREAAFDAAVEKRAQELAAQMMNAQTYGQSYSQEQENREPERSVFRRIADYWNKLSDQVEQREAEEEARQQAEEQAEAARDEAIISRAPDDVAKQLRRVIPGLRQWKEKTAKFEKEWKEYEVAKKWLVPGTITVCTLLVLILAQPNTFGQWALIFFLILLSMPVFFALRYFFILKNPPTTDRIMPQFLCPLCLKAKFAADAGWVCHECGQTHEGKVALDHPFWTECQNSECKAPSVAVVCPRCARPIVFNQAAWDAQAEKKPNWLIGGPTPIKRTKKRDLEDLEEETA